MKTSRRTTLAGLFLFAVLASVLPRPANAVDSNAILVAWGFVQAANVATLVVNASNSDLPDDGWEALGYSFGALDAALGTFMMGWSVFVAIDCDPHPENDCAGEGAPYFFLIGLAHTILGAANIGFAVGRGQGPEDGLYLEPLVSTLGPSHHSLGLRLRLRF